MKRTLKTERRESRAPFEPVSIRILAVSPQRVICASSSSPDNAPLDVSFQDTKGRELF